jgi:hypothetical protein
MLVVPYREICLWIGIYWGMAHASAKSVKTTKVSFTKSTKTNPLNPVVIKTSGLFGLHEETGHAEYL